MTTRGAPILDEIIEVITPVVTYDATTPDPLRRAFNRRVFSPPPLVSGDWYIQNKNLLLDNFDSNGNVAIPDNFEPDNIAVRVSNATQTFTISNFLRYDPLKSIYAHQLELVENTGDIDSFTRSLGSFGTPTMIAGRTFTVSERIGATWADHRDFAAGEFLQASAVVGGVVTLRETRFIVRATAHPWAAGQNFRDSDGVLYAILGVGERYGRRDYLELYCRSELAT